MHYYTITDWMADHQGEWQLENLFMETQGNWGAFKQSYQKAVRVYY